MGILPPLTFGSHIFDSIILRFRFFSIFHLIGRKMKYTMLALLALLLQLVTASPVLDSPAGIPGGFAKMDPKGADAAVIGKVAAGLLSDSRNALFHLKLVKVENIKVKVVNGLTYRLALIVGSTSCLREEEEEYSDALTRCSKSGDDEVWGSTQTCNIDIHVKLQKEKASEADKEGKDGNDGQEGRKHKKIQAVISKGSYDE